jgi:ABC-2 type transport system permease protein
MMKILDIACKDMVRSFRSGFMLIMMFVAPLLITGLIYFAFGCPQSGGFNLPVTRVQVVNLDRPAAQAGLAAGQMLVDRLQDGSLAKLLVVTNAPDEASARAAVDRREADVAIIIPADFTTAIVAANSQAAVTLYHDPTLSIQPGLVKVLVSDFVDGFVGARIALDVAGDQMRARGVALDDTMSRSLVQRFVDWLQTLSHGTAGETATPPLITRSPSPVAAPENLQSGMVASVMAGMLIFFAFFTGSASASSIVYEDEEGTLARLSTTPTSQAAILGGKLGAVLLTVTIQASVLLVVAGLIFSIHWGEPLTVALAMFGLVVAASGLGVLIMSFIKTTRQAGPVQGALMTVTGMLGGLFTAWLVNLPAALDTLTLTMPQGWALRSWKLALAGAHPGEVFLPVVVLVVMGAAFLIVGVRLFHKRFA